MAHPPSQQAHVLRLFSWMIDQLVLRDLSCVYLSSWVCGLPTVALSLGSVVSASVDGSADGVALRTQAEAHGGVALAVGGLGSLGAPLSRVVRRFGARLSR